MRIQLVAQETITIGEPATVEGRSPSQPYGVVFEDDGETGYLYALDFDRQDQPIVDALHVYNADAVTDRDEPSVVQLVWSHDGLKAALLINRYPHAVFDFESQRGYCRTGFPPPTEDWTRHGHEWSDEAQALFE